jgi:RNA polymerase sigma factor for flagellar operon FliA
VNDATVHAPRRRGRPPKPRDAALDAYRQTPSVGLRNALVERYLHVVRYNAERVHKRLPESVDVEDLVSAGVFGLMKAIDGFDPQRGVKFETYSAPRIRGAIMDELREMDPVPRLARQRAKKLDASRAKLTQRLSRRPSEHELAKDLKLSPDAYCHVRDTAAPDGQTVTSIHGEVFEAETGKRLTVGDVMADDRTPAPDDGRRDGFRSLIRSLPRAMKLLVTLYYVEDMTQGEIGRAMGLSESRVSQMHGEARRIMRSALTADGQRRN